jgi:hypothetical protein
MQDHNSIIATLDGNAIHFDVDYTYNVVKGPYLHIKIKAYSPKYKITYELDKQLDVDTVPIAKTYILNASYAIKNNGVSLSFNDTSHKSIQIRFEYGILRGEPQKMTYELYNNGTNIIVALKDEEIANLKRKYDELLNSKSA